MEFAIKENSFLAKIAAWKLRTKSVAIVFGKTIYLHNTSKAKFLSDTKWLRHELMHIEQYKRYGLFSFTVRYLAESIKKGYYKNRFEVEARSVENREDYAAATITSIRQANQA